MVVFHALCLRSALRCGDPEPVYESYCTAAWIVFVCLCQYWLVSVTSVDNELLRTSVESVAGTALNCVLCLCLWRTAS